MTRLLVATALLAASGTATAEPTELAQQVQIDGGLSVIGVGFEIPAAPHFALQIETFVFGTYFLPWFDLGEDVKGIGGGFRPTWFANENGRGLYVSPYVRGAFVGQSSLFAGDGFALTTGVFAGWAFGLTDRLDLRVGGGIQYIRARLDTDEGTTKFSTPFVAIDAVLGYRL